MPSKGKDRKQALPRGHVLRDSYRIDRVLGEGGSAITYLAHHVGLNQKVAIKEYLPAEAGKRADAGANVLALPGKKAVFQQGLHRFADEARTLASFKHPSIVSVADVFKSNATAYIVMEYVEGESLAERLQRERTIEAAALRNILEPMLNALETIHTRGILHRDIKPENIYLRRSGHPVLLDFGISLSMQERNAHDLPVMLTPGFAPIEQYTGKGKQGPWTDIYALGATLYQAITGSEPPPSPERIIEDGYTPASKAAGVDYSPALRFAIDRALAVKPGHRPRSIAEFRRLISAPVPSRNTLIPARWSGRTSHNAPERQSRPKASIRPHVALASGLLAVMIAGTGYTGWSKYNQIEALKAKTAQARILAERGRSEATQRRELERWQLAESEAIAKIARQKAARQARRRAAQAERRRAAEAAQRQAELETQRQAEREARRRAAGRLAANSRSKKPNDPLGGLRSFFENLLPR